MNQTISRSAEVPSNYVGVNAVSKTTQLIENQDVRPPVTGNAKADADIAAFYKARDKILKLKEKQAL